jgi:hypothetical protein
MIHIMGIICEFERKKPGDTEGSRATDAVAWRGVRFGFKFMFPILRRYTYIVNR